MSYPIHAGSGFKTQTDSGWYRLPYKARDRIQSLLLTADVIESTCEPGDFLAHEARYIRQDVWRLIEALCERFDTAD